MCGRVTLSRFDAEAIARFLDVSASIRFGPRYNIAPTQLLPALRLAPDGKRELVEIRWGIPTRWNPSIINVRGETATEKKTFKESFLQRRCLVPVDGFYEWKKSGRTRQAYHIVLKDRGIYALGAIWQPPDLMHGESAASCAVVTVAANIVVKPLHDRMPLILDPNDYSQWLDSKTPIETVNALLRSFPDDKMIAYPVGQWVNNAKNEGPKCLEPAAPVVPDKTLFD